MFPKCGLPGLLSTESDSRSSEPPTCTHGATVQLMPLVEWNWIMPCPPQFGDPPEPRNTATHRSNSSLYTTVGSPKFTRPPAAPQNGWLFVQVVPLSVE